MSKIFLIFSFLASFSAFSSNEVGIVSSVKGGAFVIRADKKTPLVEGSVIYEGDKIETDKVGSINVLYDDNSMQTVNSNTTVVIDSISGVNEGSSYFTLVFGTLKSVVGKRKDKQKYEIEAGDVSLGIRGTSLQVSLNGSAYELVVFEGNVEVRPIVTTTSSGGDDTSTTSDNDSTTGTGTGTGTTGTKKTGTGVLSVGAGQVTGSGQEVVSLSPEQILKIVEEVTQAEVEAVTASNEAQAASSDNGVDDITETIEQDVVDATEATDAVKDNSSATESMEDQLDKGRSLLINLKPSVRSLVKALEDIR